MVLESSEAMARLNSDTPASPEQLTPTHETTPLREGATLQQTADSLSSSNSHGKKGKPKPRELTVDEIAKVTRLAYFLRFAPGNFFSSFQEILHLIFIFE